MEASSRERISAAARDVHRRTCDALARGASSAECAELSRALARALEAELERVAAEGAAPECAPACAFCCHQRVGVLPYEAAALVEALAAMPPARADAVKERVRANARLVDGLGPDRHRSANLPCAFLEQGRCTAYELRPSICASFHSMSKARCAYAFEHPRDMATPRNSRPVVLELQVFADTLVEAARTALRGAGLACENLELHQAVRAVLDDPEAMNRWRAGGSLATGTSVEVQQQ